MADLTTGAWGLIVEMQVGAGDFEDGFGVWQGADDINHGAGAKGVGVAQG